MYTGTPWSRRAGGSMDNLTHTVIGCIAGECLARTTPTLEPGLPREERRRLLVALAAIGGNLPDLDLFYSYLGEPKLGYLLQHRGYTHTVAGCLVLALLLYGGAECWMRWRGLAAARGDRMLLAATALFGTLLHLGMDYLNSYGVHPFWPFDDRWVYGDSVFIVEPLYWVAAAPLLFTIRSVAWRCVLSVAILLGPTLGLLLHMATASWCAAYLVLALALVALGARVPARTAALLSAMAMLLITGTFAAAGAVAARRVDSLAAADFPGQRRIDHVLNPEPMNPLCWDLLLLQTQGDSYLVRRAVLSVAPAVMTAARCPTAAGRGPITAPLTPVPAADSSTIAWAGQFAMSRVTLAELVAGHCVAADLMQFARAPFAARRGGGWVIGDLRFDRGPGLGMSEFALGAAQPGPCPRKVPWVAPRADLLR